jgi:hypothetical protein
MRKMMPGACFELGRLDDDRGRESVVVAVGTSTFGVCGAIYREHGAATNSSVMAAG